MRIVYDDAQQSGFAAIFERFMDGLDPESLLEYSHGMDRIRTFLLKQRLEDAARPAGFRIGKIAEHANGIGNNCRHPVYFQPEGSIEMQRCCDINLNTGLCGEAFASLQDYDGNRIGPAYEIRPRGIRKKPA